MKWLFALPLLLPSLLFGQGRCGTDLLPENLSRPESIRDLQNWITNQVKLKKEQAPRVLRLTSYEVPVVFHIIHNGEPIGSGTNLAMSRITEQLEILNRDFRRQNTDASLTPVEFLPVAADTEINFVMARRDPEGLPTSGITRTEGPLTSYSDDASVLTSIIQWPPEDVVNIYIAPLSSSLGFAKFPYSNIEGMDSRFNGYREVDGIFVNYRYTGNNNEPGIDFESKGRTVTHEMGHYFGLIHIFSGCGSGDYCEDTPSQSGYTSGCPADKTSCTENQDMIQNYLDYTDDACMNLFTLCQKDRMQAVLEASPRRNSLLTSPLLQVPVYVANDLGIKSIESPQKFDCSSSVTPQILLRNYGSNSIGSFSVAFYVNDQLQETKTVPVTSLDLLDTYFLSFNPLVLDDQVTNTIRFSIQSVNSGTDGNTENNEKSVTLQPSDASLLPYDLNFETPGVIQAETEIGTVTSWNFTTAPYIEALNQAIYQPFFQKTENFGVKDLFFTHLIDVSNLTSLQLTFNYAYAQNPGDNYLDGLIVAVSKDCGQSFSYLDYAFERYGSSLATAPATADSFVPSGQNDWEEVSLNLTQYLNGSTLQVAFIGINGGGNNLYIDNIVLSSGELRALDIGIKEVVNISPVTCRTKVFPEISVKNFGYTTVRSFTLSINQDGFDTLIFYNNQSIVSGATKVFSNTYLDLNEGINNLTFVLQDLNDLGDEYHPNDTFRISVIVDSSSDIIPFKETFDNPSWILNEHSPKPVFSTSKIAGNQVLQGLAYDSGTVGSKTYISSPTFQTGKNKEAAVRFRYSYAQRPGFNDNLKLFLSNDCGSNYTFKVMDWDSEDLSSVQSLDAWKPASSDDWKYGFVDISEYLIWGNLRAAFVFTNGNGNNLYLDDIEVILTNDPDLPVFEQRFEVYPIPAVGSFNVAMNLPKKETIRIRLIDMSGKLVLDKDFPNTLNQTYELIAPSQRGFYLLQVIGEQVFQYRRIFIDQ